MTTITSKLYKSHGTDTPVARLLSEIESEAAKRGYQLSRWQSNKAGRRVAITYAVHTGDRADQFRYMDDDAVIASVFLTQIEGTTEWSEAYREFSRLLSQVQAA